MNELLEFLLEPLSYQFMQRALLAGLMVGAITSLIGCFVVIRGMSFFGEALGHSILPGVAIAYLIAGSNAGLGLFAGGLVAGIGSALGIGWLTRDNRMKEDTAIGIVYVAMFALGVAIITANPNAQSRDLQHILFGDILGISETDLLITAVCGLIVAGTIRLFYKELTIISFDVSLARTLKLPAEGLRMLLLVLIAVAIIASIQVVGTALMLAMLIVPAATARLLTQRLPTMMIAATLIGMFGSTAGVFASFYLDVATGPAIVLLITGIFALALLYHWLRGRIQD
jgi:manganese/iron transport system permease protein